MLSALLQPESKLLTIGLQIEKDYKVKVADFCARGRFLDQSPSWIEVDFRESPAGGWQRKLWLRQSEISWIGEVDGRVEQFASLRHGRERLRYAISEMQRPGISARHPRRKEATGRFKQVEVEIKQPDAIG